MTDRKLSDQERRVLRYMSYGMSNREIAEKMHVTLHTINTYVGRLFDKLGARSRPYAIRRGFETGDLSVDIEWSPDWVTCPGETLEEWFQYTHVPRSIAWKFYDIPEEQLTDLLAGREPLTPDIAARLEKMTTVPANFWTRYEAIYRNGLAVGLSHAHDNQEMA